MKRFFVFLLAVLIFTSLYSCGGEKNTEVDVVEDEQEESTKDSSEAVESEVEEESGDEVTVMWFENPPHTFIDKNSGEMSGAVYEMIEEISSKAGISVKWSEEATSIPRQLEIIEKNEKKYASAELVQIPARGEIGIFPEKAYFLSQTVLAFRKDSPINSIEKVEDILDITIGYAEKAFLSPFMRDERIKLDLMNSNEWNELNLKKVISKRQEAAYAPDKAGFLTLLKDIDTNNELKILDLPEEESPFNLLFSKMAEEEVQKYNDYIKDIDVDNMYLDYLKKYLDVSQL